MLGAEEIGISKDQQSGRSDGADGLGGQILDLSIHLRLLGKEPVEVFRPRGDAHVLLVPGDPYIISGFMFPIPSISPG